MIVDLLIVTVVHYTAYVLCMWLYILFKTYFKIPQHMIGWNGDQRGIVSHYQTS